MVDGGSADDSRKMSATLVDMVIQSPKGRAVQMNNGAISATGDVLLFLHADTLLPSQAAQLVDNALLGGRCWGRFNIRLSGTHLMFRIIERMMNWRSCLTGIATGDQAIFMTRESYQQVGGFPEIALMEDIEMSKRLRQVSRPACVKVPAITSSRRWEQGGIFRTIFLMWRIRLSYFFGAGPEKLAAIYHQVR